MKASYLLAFFCNFGCKLKKYVLIMCPLNVSLVSSFINDDDDDDDDDFDDEDEDEEEKEDDDDVNDDDDDAGWMVASLSFSAVFSVRSLRPSQEGEYLYGCKLLHTLPCTDMDEVKKCKPQKKRTAFQGRKIGTREMDHPWFVVPA